VQPTFDNRFDSTHHVVFNGKTETIPPVAVITLYPVSLYELSNHAQLITVVDRTVPTNPDGVIGTVVSIMTKYVLDQAV
jgi:hypothetical protein